MPVTKICETCGNAFQVRPYLAKAKKHCSNQCRVSSSRASLTCIWCGKVFWKWKSQIRPGNPGKFCSKACANRGKTKDKPPKRVREPVFKCCETCGKTFSIPPARKNTARFCSNQCKNTNPDFKREASEKQQADKHWRWAGGKYKKRDGYVRRKRQNQGKEISFSEHRVVMLNWMLEQEPEHSFLITIDGIKQLHPDIEVHHVDRNRSHNERENLLAATKNAHAQIHHRGKKPESWECWPSNPVKW